MNWSLAGTDLVALVLGYLLGSIPFGLVVTRMAGLGDIRAIGSGNIGATNVLRTGRKSLAAVTLVLDALKGTAAVLIAHAFAPRAAIVAGFGAFVGHIFPVWLGFRGGKGVATYLGVLVALSWPAAIVFAVVWLGVAALTRYSSAAALTASLATPPALWVMGEQGARLPFSSSSPPSSGFAMRRTSPGSGRQRRQDRAAAMNPPNGAGTRLSDAERLAWLRLIRSENIGPVTFRELMRRYGNAGDALAAVPELAARGGRRIRIASPAEAERELAAAVAAGARLIAMGEPEYPALLGHIDDAPPLIAVRGDPACLVRPIVAVVGSRNASVAGRKFAMQIAAGLGERGYVIASGLARGIDAAAHEAAVKTGTVAVYAGGLDRLLPARECRARRPDHRRPAARMFRKCPWAGNRAPAIFPAATASSPASPSAW